MLSCWCGNASLSPYGVGFRHCAACETLVSELDGAAASYDGSYWFDAETPNRKGPNLESRARLDLPERCLHWLRTVLQYKPPPARALEIGCAHGGFVAMLGWAGYHASGLEMSPEVADVARRTFGVEMLQGPVEAQSIEPGSLDVVAMFDVLEHLPDPTATLARLESLLAPDGLLLIQTPRFPEGAKLADLKERADPFLAQIENMAQQHMYLLSRQSATKLLAAAGFFWVEFEPAIFAHYDMYFAAARSPLIALTQAGQETALLATPGGRMVLSLLDAARQRDMYQVEAHKRLAVVEGLAGEVERLRKPPRRWFA